MRIAIQTLGTRGDVQPYLALALGLMRRGHQVQLAAPARFCRAVEDRGVPCAPLPGEYLDLLDTPHGKAAIAGSHGLGAGFKLLEHVRPLMRRVMNEEWLAVRAFKPDLIVYHPKSLASPHMAAALRCPHVLASPLPGFTPTAAFPSPLLPFASLGPLNRLSHVPVIEAASLLFSGVVREWRAASLGTTGRARPPRPLATLYAYSRHVVPVPRDWSLDVLVTGYWFLESGEQRLPQDVAAFLEAGEPPVYVGFGSMPGIDAQRLTALFVEALGRMGRRGFLVTGGGGLAPREVPATIKVVAECAHDRLLPRVASAFHHGGAGTTAAALRAGIPMAVCPFFGDQSFWGRRIAELGAGPPPLDRKALSVDTIAAAIRSMDDPAVRSRAAALGCAIRQEDGVAAAAAFIDGLVEMRR